MLNKIKSRVKEDKGATGTVELLLLLVLTILIVLLVGGRIYKAVDEKTQETAECIKNSNKLILTGTNDCVNGTSVNP